MLSVPSLFFTCLPLALPQAPPQLPGTLKDVTALPDNDPQNPNIHFIYKDMDPNVHEEAGGAAVGDFDADGWLDIFLPNNRFRANQLLKNLGNGKFTDVAAAKHVDDPVDASACGLFVDYDNDGDLDIFVACHLGGPSNPLGGAPLKLFRNKGSAGGYDFVDVTNQAGFLFKPTQKDTTQGFVAGACAGDYDVDGWVDIFIAWNNGNYGTKHEQNRLFHNSQNPNQGDPGDPNYSPRRFSDATPGSGIDFDFTGNAWQPVWIDINRDGYPDLHVNVDFYFDRMFLNLKNGQFTEISTSIGLNGNPPEELNEMGCALGDFDNDLDIDLHLTNMAMMMDGMEMGMDRLYRNDSVAGNMAYVDVAMQSDVADSMFGWGDVFFDFDNDGDLDHATVSGSTHNLNEPAYNSFQLNMYPMPGMDNMGIMFENVSDQVPEFSSIGMPVTYSGRGLVAFDYNGDGAVDLFETRDPEDLEPAALYKNTSMTGNDWFEVDLVGANGSLNTSGADLYIRQMGKHQMREITTGSSFLSQEPSRQHFGLGAGGAASFEWMVVRWPVGGACQIVHNINFNAVNVIQRASMDDRGDINGDGHVDATDCWLLYLMVYRSKVYHAMYAELPGMITGDLDGNGIVDANDFNNWFSIPQH
ncbi:MAG: VCBS repeat-containing protein [Planctomycetes bacterium]|nr:VCBS repeat-containing protein [Planctomycetota bacterium]